MKRTILFSVFVVFLAFALPPLLSVPGSSAAAPVPDKPVPTSAGTPAPADPPPAQLLADAAIPVSLLSDAGIDEISMAEYLPLALAAEMPASFDSAALKAQAVALRSYALYWQSERKSAHPDADVCTSSACCTARTDLQSLRDSWGADFDAYYEKICAAVRETDGQYLVWQSEPALTVFHAASAGTTEFGAALGMDKAYLVSVGTPELGSNVRNLITTVEVAPEDFRTSILSVCPEAALSGAAETWLGQTQLTRSGRVESMTIGGQTLSGLALRQLFSLRSTDFTLTLRDGCFVFSVRGYGHGLGMSQHGANLMAQSGADYAEILQCYYPGTELVVAMRRS